MIRLSIDLNHGFTKNVGANRPIAWLLLALSVWLVSGCSSVSVTTQSAAQSAAQPADNQEEQADALDPELETLLAGDAAVAVPALIVAEREASSSRDLTTLSLLWRHDARIVDGRTTADSTDDYTWQGLPAILDRYELAVFPNPPPPFEESLTFDVANEGDEASVVYGVDEWRFVYTDGRWWIVELAYQRP